MTDPSTPEERDARLVRFARDTIARGLAEDVESLLRERDRLLRLAASLSAPAGVRGPVLELAPDVARELMGFGETVEQLEKPEEVWEPCQDLLRWKEAHCTLPMPFSACTAGHVDHLVRPHALTLGEQHQGRMG